MRTPQSRGVLALLALLSAGCGSNAPSESGTAAASSARQKEMKFSACMRDNGVSAFPDPDASGAMRKCGARYARKLGLEGKG
jgi:hypothetical protein